MYWLTVPEAGSLKSLYLPGRFLFRAVREHLFQLFELHPQFTGSNLHLHLVATLWVCSPISPFHKDTGQFGLRATQRQYDLILVNYNCNDPISKFTFWDARVLRLQHMNCGGGGHIIQLIAEALSFMSWSRETNRPTSWWTQTLIYLATELMTSWINKKSTV